MNREVIAKKVHSIVKDELGNTPFDKALPELRKVLWNIADDYGVEGAEIFKIYMDWLSKQKNN